MTSVYERIGAIGYKVIGAIEEQGEATMELFHSWAYGPRSVPNGGERGGGLGTAAPEETFDAASDRKAAGYENEYCTLLARIEADLRRVEHLHAIAVVEDRLKTRNRSGDLDPLLAAEAAAAGYCASCWRLDQTCNDREKDGEGNYYDRNACRRCVRFKNEHGIYPPLDLLHIWHKLGRRQWTTAEVDAALAAAKQPKKKAS